MKEKDKKKKVAQTEETSMIMVKGEDDDEKVNGDARDLAFEKYMFTDDDDDSAQPGSNRKEKQRLARNTSEKKRKDKIKLGIKKISSLLPETYKDPKDNYVIMLDKTVGYIEELKLHNDQLLMGDRQSAQEIEIERLQKQVEVLHNKLKDAQALFQQFGPDFSMDIAQAIGNWRGKENSSKKGLEKCLSTIISSIQAGGGLPDVDLPKKGKKNKNRSPTVSEHLTVSENTGSDVEIGLMLPTLLPDGTLPPFPGGLTGFSPTGQTAIAAGQVPMLPPGVSTAMTLPPMLPGGIPNSTNAGIYGSGMPVPVLTSSGNIVFMSPNSAQQQGVSNEMDMDEDDNQSQSDHQLDISHQSFTDNDLVGTSTPAHNFDIQLKNEHKAMDTKKDLSLDISDNPLLDPELQSLSSAVNINQTSIASSAFGSVKVTMAGSMQQLNTCVSTPMLAGSVMASMASAGGALPTPPVSVVRPTQPSVSAPNVNPGKVQGTYVLHNGQLLLVNSAASSMPLSNVPPSNTSMTSTAMNSAGLLRTNLPNTAVTPVSTSLSVSTTLTPSTGIKMAATANPGTVPNIPGLQTQSVMINGQQQTVQVVPNQNMGTNQTGQNQTVTINTPQGQVTMNTTPSQPNQLPSALILPTGQIVPVVTQPQMLFPQNQCVPVNGGLLMAGSQGQSSAAVTPGNQVGQLPGKPVINPAMLGPNAVRPVVGAQATTTIRLPNGMLATVPQQATLPQQGAMPQQPNIPQQNNAIIRSQGNIIRTGSNTIHHLPGAGALQQNPSLMMSSQAGHLGAKPSQSLPGQPIIMPPGTTIPGQFILGPNNQVLQNFTGSHVSDGNINANMPLSVGTGQQIPVATSGDTVPTSTTTESKPTSATITTGATTSSVAAASGALPQTVTAVLTPDGNIIIMPVSNTTVPVTSTTTTSQAKSSSKGKKTRALKPKPSSGGLTSTTDTATTATSSHQAVGSPCVDTPDQLSLPSSMPLSISVSDNNAASSVSSTASSKAQDILAKATASIFSPSGTEISPTMSGFYNQMQDDDNPLQIDTGPAGTGAAPHDADMDQTPMHLTASPVTQSKPKPKRPPRKRSKKKAAAIETGLHCNEGMMETNDQSDVNLLEQLAEKMDEEDESDITDFSDLITLHEPAMVESKMNSKVEQSEPTVKITTDQSETQSMPSELSTIPMLVSETSPEETQPPVVNALSSHDNSINDMMLMSSLQNATGLTDLPPPSTTSSPSVSQFSDLSFLCAVAEQQQHEQHQDQLEHHQEQTTDQPAHDQPASLVQQPDQPVSQDHQPVCSQPQQLDSQPPMVGSQPQFQAVGQQNQLEPTLLSLEAPVPPVCGLMEQPPPGGSSKKNKSSKKEKRKKDKKKKDKDRDRDKEVLSEPPQLLLPGGMPSLQPQIEATGQAPIMPTLETQKAPKSEKEKKKKKNKKKDKERNAPPSLTTPVDTSGSTIEENTLGSLFSNMDQSISAPQFFDMPDSGMLTTPHTADVNLNTLLATDNTADTSLDTSMEVDDHGKKSKSKSKSKRSRSKKKSKDNSSEVVPDLMTSTPTGKITVPEPSSLVHMDIHKTLIEMQTIGQTPGLDSTVTSLPLAVDSTTTVTAPVQSQSADVEKNANRRKQQIRPEDIIPDAITFTENDLSDVLDQVEGFGESLQQASTKPKARSRGKKSHAATDDVCSPPSKRARHESEGSVDRLIIIPSAKKAEERIPEEKLDEIFGPKEKNDPVDGAGDMVNKGTEERGLDVFEFDTGDDMETNQPVSKQSPDKKEKKKSKKSKKKSKEQQAQAQAQAQAQLQVQPEPQSQPQCQQVEAPVMELEKSDKEVLIEAPSMFSLDKPPGSVSSMPELSTKLIDSITSMMDQPVEDQLPAPSKSPEKPETCDQSVDTYSVKTKHNNDLEKVEEASKLEAGVSLLMDKSDEKSSMTLPASMNTPSSARHSNIFSMAVNMAPPKYGPIVQPKTPKPAQTTLNPTQSNNQLPSSRPQCARSLEESSAKTGMLDQRSKEHDLASSLPDELDIPDIVEENALRESENALRESEKLSDKQDHNPSPVNKDLGSQEPDAFMRPESSTSDLSNVPHLHNVSSPSSIAYAPDTMLSQGGAPGKDVGQSSRLKQCRDSPGSNQQQNSTGSMIQAPNMATSMGATRDTPSSRPLSSGQSNMFVPPAPPVTSASSCALQGRQLEHYPFSPPPFPPVTNSSTSSRSSCSINSSGDNTPFSISFSSSSNTSTNSAYGARHQFPPFYSPPFLPMGQKDLLGAGPPPPSSSSMPSQMPNMDVPPYGRSSSSGNMEVPSSKHGPMHNSTMDNRDKPLSHNMGQSQNTNNANNMRNDNTNKSRERDQSRHASSLPPPPQLSHPPDKNMAQSNNNNRLPTPTHNQGQNMPKQRSSSIGRSPQEPGQQYMGGGGGFPSQSPSGMPSGSSTLTSPPLHHPRPPSEPRGSANQRPGYEPLMFPGPGSQFSPVPSFSVYDPPPLHFTKESAMPSQGSSTYSQSRNSSGNISSKQSSQAQRPSQASQGPSHGHGNKNMVNHKQQSHPSSQQHPPQSHHTSHQQSHQASQQQQHSQNPSSKSSTSRSKSKKTSNSSSTKQLQHYDTDASGAMFDPSRSITPYFPISNLSPQPRNLPSDVPTYLPGNFFGNTGRPLSNANSLQHKEANPFQPFFAPPSRAVQNGIFQASPFGMNHMHPAAAANHSSPSQIAQHSSSVSMAPHMPNFNLNNLFPDMSNPSQADISPMKFPPSNAIIPPQGSGMDHNAMHHHQAAAGSLYHNRSQVPPPMLHNVAFNSILGHQHGFDARGMTPGMNSSVGGPFGGSGHAASFGMPHLNFPMHDH